MDLLDQIPDATLGANYETTSECFMAVNNDVADVVVVDEPTARLRWPQTRIFPL